MKANGFIKHAPVVATLLLTGAVFAGSPTKLNIGEYLDKADDGKIYPSAAQIEMLRPFMPEKAYRPAPPISNRAFWKRIAGKESAQKIFEEAVAGLDKKPEIPISDEIYRRANKEGNRGIYKPRYYRTMEVLEKAVIAECIENKGRFIPQIEEHINAIMAMKSWLHPNHDPGNAVLEGKRVAIDLGARKFGSVIMLSDVLLEDKLPAELRKAMRDQIQWRMIDSYLKSCRGEDKKGNSWIWGTSNWNAVCTGGTLFSALSASDDPEERLAVLGSAINAMKNYLTGFGADGYCSEGIGYWNYGFGNYLYLAQTVYDYTDGKIDLFTFTDPEKMKRVGNFPANFQIQNDVYPCFADGGARIKEGSDNYAYILSAKNYGARKPSFSRPADITMQLQEWADPVSYVDPAAVPVELPAHTYFDDFGIVISRGGQKVPFSIAIKAGHNNENHNHMDVGSYVMVLEDDHIMCGDIGAPPYKAGAFSPKHPARSSWGHPVPRIDGKLQSEGKQFKGEILEAEFSEIRDRVVVDIQGGYKVPTLGKLIRSMENDKSGKGTITIVDEFAATRSIDFGTAVMTHGDYKVVDGNTILLMRDGRKIKVKISADGGSFRIKDEKVPVKDIRYADEAFRIGIDFTKKLTAGSITMVFTPEG
ncbi:heparinase II/III family protein [Pontiellaceae bacterium B12227]|nr:heparinase II/III family protein [Pontiellaceae bacterium B12227]